MLKWSARELTYREVDRQDPTRLHCSTNSTYYLA